MADVFKKNVKNQLSVWIGANLWSNQLRETVVGHMEKKTLLQNWPVNMLDGKPALLSSYQFSFRFHPGIALLFFFVF